MRRMTLVLLVALAGCGGPGPKPDPSRKVTWAEYQRMDAEQKDDPYVLDNLDDDAKQKLARAAKARKKK